MAQPSDRTGYTGYQAPTSAGSEQNIDRLGTRAALWRGFLEEFVDGVHLEELSANRELEYVARAEPSPLRSAFRTDSSVSAPFLLVAWRAPRP